MNKPIPARVMREHPDIDQLKRQAKELLEAFRASSPEAVAEVAAHFSGASPATFALHDAQLVLARACGFDSWPKMKAAVEGVTAAQLHVAVGQGDVPAVRALLARRPELVKASVNEVTALHLAVFRRDLPMVKALLECGADPDASIWPHRDATTPRIMARDRGFEEISEAIRALRDQHGQRSADISPEVGRKLHKAFQTGREEALLEVFNEHPEFAQMYTEDRGTMLHQTATRGALLLTRWLLDHGVDVNARMQGHVFWNATFVPGLQSGWTALDFAAVGCGEEWLFDNDRFQRVAALLLERGAELGPLSAAAIGRWEYLEQFTARDLSGLGVLEAAVRGNQPEVLRRLLDLGLDPDERVQVGHIDTPAWSHGGPLFQAVALKHIDMARLLLERGANPNADVFTAGSAAFRAFSGDDPEMIALIQKHGGRLDAGSAGYARQVEMARRMLAGELDPHLDPNDMSGHTVAEQLLWGGASSGTVEIVRMALERIHWPPEDSRWHGTLMRPLHNIDDYGLEQQNGCVECFKLILARCGPHHLADHRGDGLLHEVASGSYATAVRFAEVLLDAGARLDVRDRLLASTPLGWACRWGRIEMVRLLLARGADPVEADAEPWARPLAWAERMEHRDIAALLRARASL